LPAARQLIALLKSHIDGDDQQFLSVALQLAAHEARIGHGRIAQQLKDLVDEARSRSNLLDRGKGPVPLAQPRGELASLLSAKYPDTRFGGMVLTPELSASLRRILLEQRQTHRLLARNLVPRRKLLLLGPPGSGKTMTASALAGELHLPLFTILLEGLITKYMGETAAKLRLVFDAMVKMRGVYFFDEFDAIGSRRSSSNDVGEIRRVLNSFLQFLENDDSISLIVAATNHPELLDKALFRRFDDVLQFSNPTSELAERLFKSRLATFDTTHVDWKCVIDESAGLSYADISRASDEAAKISVLDDADFITTDMLLSATIEKRDRHS
jgi:SpoVK/Ycf46/Vps4 family AAA+-type ATPase